MGWGGGGHTTCIRVMSYDAPMVLSDLVAAIAAVKNPAAYSCARTIDLRAVVDLARG